MKFRKSSAEPELDSVLEVRHIFESENHGPKFEKKILGIDAK